MPAFVKTADALELEGLGANFDSAKTSIVFRVVFSAATHLEVWIYDQPLGTQQKMRVPLTRDSTNIWSVNILLAALNANKVNGPIYYGYRAWGPNWPFNPSWTKGFGVGFKEDVDGQGNRFNPNKLLLDPYAREISHDPLISTNGGNTTDGNIYTSGSIRRNFDTGAEAPKGIVVPIDGSDTGGKPTRAFKDDIIYEVHLRGLINNDQGIPFNVRGTYAGAALKASYLKEL